MRIIRPKQIKSSPDKLAKQMGIEAVKPRECQPVPMWGQDFFMVYPEWTEGQDDVYRSVRAFFHLDKRGQRKALGKAVGKERVLPAIYTHEAAEMLPASPLGYVVRPLHHEKGEGFRTTADPVDFREGQEYVSPIFPKTHEYRLVFVYGKFAFMQKKQPEGRKAEECWSDVPFTYIRDTARSYLKLYTDVFDVLCQAPMIRDACIVGVDVLYNHADRSYRVCEVNTAPTLMAPGLAEGRELRGRVIDLIKEKHQ